MRSGIAGRFSKAWLKVGIFLGSGTDLSATFTQFPALSISEQVSGLYRSFAELDDAILEKVVW